MMMARWFFALALGAAFIAFGIMKFAGPNPIFAFIEFKTGLGAAEPFGAWATGIAEIIAGLAITIPAARRLGLWLAGVITSGAILMHFSPFLGIATPSGFVKGAQAPWEAGDFLPAEAGLFFAALALAALILVNIWLEHRAAR
jgi:uncharacterized membrane protein YphA (DoxX/SURF4 family)